jgi:3' terminal RNA ribose 2'-O-methyltransferase Hen1
VFISLSVTASPGMPVATDLGYLLHKHPERVQPFELPVGAAQVFWPEATPQRATCALLLEVDPIGLVRGRRDGGGFALAQYVNDRPYAATSMLAVALGKVFRTAIAGRCEARPALVAEPVPLEVHVPAVAGGADLVEQLFAPLGWSVSASPVVLDPEVPAWGDSPYVDLRLSGTLTVGQALSQLYVLIPVLDDGKHYWVGDDEVDKLLRAGGTWLAEHPESALITRRYLKHQRDLVDSALQRLADVDDTEPEPLVSSATPLAKLRTQAVLSALRQEKASTVVDLGCGEGALLRELVADPSFARVLGVDVSHRALEVAAQRLRPERLSDHQRARFELLQSSVTYRDDRLAGYDAVVLMEVVEHVDPPRRPALERSVFAHARPASVIVTTPNREHNVRYPFLAPGALRHPDHRFEWSRAQFRDWASAVAATFGYDVRYEPVGDDDPEVGPPTQLAVFRRAS